MSTLLEELTALKTEEDKITGNKVANFAYDDYAYEHNDANGVDTYNVNNHQNIPNGTASIMKVNATVLTKGWRAQASAITRMLIDHFLGRCSYNLNKVNDHFSSLLTTLGNYLGVANGIATLDEDGEIPASQVSLEKIGLGNVVNTGDSSTPTADGTDKFTTGGAYVLQQDINGKAPKDHSSTSGIYGIATQSYYGHVKIAGRVFIVNSLTSQTFFPVLPSSGKVGFDYALVHNTSSSDISYTFNVSSGQATATLIYVKDTSARRLVLSAVSGGSGATISVNFHANSTSLLSFSSSQEGSMYFANMS